MFRPNEALPPGDSEGPSRGSFARPSSFSGHTPNSSSAQLGSRNSSTSPGQAASARSPSGPTRNSGRSKRGCFTCRKRKVKCNEERPTCGHCFRLHLTCNYDPAIGEPFRNRPSQGAVEPVSQQSTNWTNYVSSRASERGLNEMADVDTTPRNENYNSGATETYDISMMGDILPSLNTAAPMADQASQQRLTGPGTWELELLGEDSLWANLPILSNFISVQEPEPYEYVTTYTVPSSPRVFPMLLPPSTTANGAENAVVASSTQTAPQSNIFSPADEIILLRHFVDFAVPPILVGVEPRWNTSRDALLRLSKSSLPLRYAICAFSALSLGGNMSFSAAQSSSAYSGLAMTSLQKILDKESLDAKLESPESILATIFFLAYTDTIISDSPKSSLELLDRAYTLLKSEKPSGSSLYRQLQIWLKLLDAKIVSAGGKGIHLYPNPDTHVPESREIYASSAGNDDPNGSTEPDVSVMETEDILFNSLNRQSYNFYIQVLDFSGRIAHLDRWHRSRGSVQDELEVMLGADKVTRDLNALWTRRPAIIDLADKGDQLRQHMSSSLASKIEQHLRTYAANFYACFIHLQRVAYIHLKPTPQAKSAVAKIVHFARLTAEDGHALPASMLWPLMMAACEVEDRAMKGWIISKIEGMKEVGNAMRTAALVREIVKRQESGQRADARTVMQEAFGGVFAII